MTFERSQIKKKKYNRTVPEKIFVAIILLFSFEILNLYNITHKVYCYLQPTIEKFVNATGKTQSPEFNNLQNTSSVFKQLLLTI